MLSAIEIIEGFGKIMTGYLFVMDESEIVRKSKYIDTILYNGANIVIHVFTMHVCANESLENIYKQCCSAYVCYLEYIEQLDKTNLANNLYISDISIFVYKLTLGELVKNTGSESSVELLSGSMSNKHIIDLVIKTWNTLLAWNSPLSFNARLAICDVHLTKYAKLFHILSYYDKSYPDTLSSPTFVSHSCDVSLPRSKVFWDYLGIIQEKWIMSDNLYFTFLNEYYRTLYKLHHMNMIPNYSHMSEKILLFCIQYHLEYKVTEENIRTIVKRLVI
jgi:hypothetical protein